MHFTSTAFSTFLFGRPVGVKLRTQAGLCTLLAGLVHRWLQRGWRGLWHFGLCGGALSHIWTHCWSLSCISQTDYRSRGESWESHRVLAVYSWERLPPPPGLVI